MGDKYHFLATKLAATKMLENTNNWGDCANRNFPSVAVGVLIGTTRFGKQYYL